MTQDPARIGGATAPVPTAPAVDAAATPAAPVPAGQVAAQALRAAVPASMEQVAPMLDAWLEQFPEGEREQAQRELGEVLLSSRERPALRGRLQQLLFHLRNLETNSPGRFAALLEAAGVVASPVVDGDRFEVDAAAPRLAPGEQPAVAPHPSAAEPAQTRTLEPVEVAERVATLTQQYLESGESEPPAELLLALQDLGTVRQGLAEQFRAATTDEQRRAVQKQALALDAQVATGRIVQTGRGESGRLRQAHVQLPPEYQVRAAQLARLPAPDESGVHSVQSFLDAIGHWGPQRDQHEAGRRGDGDRVSYRSTPPPEGMPERVWLRARAAAMVGLREEDYRFYLATGQLPDLVDENGELIESGADRWAELERRVTRTGDWSAALAMGTLLDMRHAALAAERHQIELRMAELPEGAPERTQLQEAAQQMRAMQRQLRQAGHNIFAGRSSGAEALAQRQGQSATRLRERAAAAEQAGNTAEAERLLARAEQQQAAALTRVRQEADHNTRIGNHGRAASVLQTGAELQIGVGADALRRAERAGEPPEVLPSSLGDGASGAGGLLGESRRALEGVPAGRRRTQLEHRQLSLETSVQHTVGSFHRLHLPAELLGGGPAPGLDDQQTAHFDAYLASRIQVSSLLQQRIALYGSPESLSHSDAVTVASLHSQQRSVATELVGHLGRSIETDRRVEQRRQQVRELEQAAGEDGLSEAGEQVSGAQEGVSRAESARGITDVFNTSGQSRRDGEGVDDARTLHQLAIARQVEAERQARMIGEDLREARGDLEADEAQQRRDAHVAARVQVAVASLPDAPSVDSPEAAYRAARGQADAAARGGEIALQRAGATIPARGPVRIAGLEAIGEAYLDLAGYWSASTEQDGRVLGDAGRVGTQHRLGVAGQMLEHVDTARLQLPEGSQERLTLTSGRIHAAAGLAEAYAETQPDTSRDLLVDGERMANEELQPPDGIEDPSAVHQMREAALAHLGASATMSLVRSNARRDALLESGQFTFGTSDALWAQSQRLLGGLTDTQIEALPPAVAGRVRAARPVYERIETALNERAAQMFRRTSDQLGNGLSMSRAITRQTGHGEIQAAQAQVSSVISGGVWLFTLGNFDMKEEMAEAGEHALRHRLSHATRWTEQMQEGAEHFAVAYETALAEGRAFEFLDSFAIWSERGNREAHPEAYGHAGYFIHERIPGEQTGLSGWQLLGRARLPGADGQEGPRLPLLDALTRPVIGFDDAYGRLGGEGVALVTTQMQDMMESASESLRETTDGMMWIIALNTGLEVVGGLVVTGGMGSAASVANAGRTLNTVRTAAQATRAATSATRLATLTRSVQTFRAAHPVLHTMGLTATVGGGMMAANLGVQRVFGRNSSAARGFEVASNFLPIGVAHHTLGLAGAGRRVTTVGSQTHRLSGTLAHLRNAYLSGAAWRQGFSRSSLVGHAAFYGPQAALGGGQAAATVLGVHYAAEALGLQNNEGAQMAMGLFLGMLIPTGLAGGMAVRSRGAQARATATGLMDAVPTSPMTQAESVRLQRAVTNEVRRFMANTEGRVPTTAEVRGLQQSLERRFGLPERPQSGPDAHAAQRQFVEGAVEALRVQRAGELGLAQHMPQELSPSRPPTREQVHGSINSAARHLFEARGGEAGGASLAQAYRDAAQHVSGHLQQHAHAVVRASDGQPGPYTELLVQAQGWAADRALASDLSRALSTPRGDGGNPVIPQANQPRVEAVLAIELGRARTAYSREGQGRSVHDAVPQEHHPTEGSPNYWGYLQQRLQSEGGLSRVEAESVVRASQFEMFQQSVAQRAHAEQVRAGETPLSNEQLRALTRDVGERMGFDTPMIRLLAGEVVQNRAVLEASGAIRAASGTQAAAAPQVSTVPRITPAPETPRRAVNQQPPPDGFTSGLHPELGNNLHYHATALRAVRDAMANGGEVFVANLDFQGFRTWGNVGGEHAQGDAFIRALGTELLTLQEQFPGLHVEHKGGKSYRLLYTGDNPQGLARAIQERFGAGPEGAAVRERVFHRANNIMLGRRADDPPSDRIRLRQVEPDDVQFYVGFRSQRFERRQGGPPTEADVVRATTELFSEVHVLSKAGQMHYGNGERPSEPVVGYLHGDGQGRQTAQGHARRVPESERVTFGDDPSSAWALLQAQDRAAAEGRPLAEVLTPQERALFLLSQGRGEHPRGAALGEFYVQEALGAAARPDAEPSNMTVVTGGDEIAVVGTYTDAQGVRHIRYSALDLIGFGASNNISGVRDANGQPVRGPDVADALGAQMTATIDQAGSVVQTQRGEFTRRLAEGSQALYGEFTQNRLPGYEGNLSIPDRVDIPASRISLQEGGRGERPVRMRLETGDTFEGRVVGSQQVEGRQVDTVHFWRPGDPADAPPRTAHVIRTADGTGVDTVRLQIPEGRTGIAGFTIDATVGRSRTGRIMGDTDIVEMPGGGMRLHPNRIPDQPNLRQLRQIDDADVGHFLTVLSDRLGAFVKNRAKQERFAGREFEAQRFLQELDLNLLAAGPDDPRVQARMQADPDFAAVYGEMQQIYVRTLQDAYHPRRPNAAEQLPQVVQQAARDHLIARRPQQAAPEAPSAATGTPAAADSPPAGRPRGPPAEAGLAALEIPAGTSTAHRPEGPDPIRTPPDAAQVEGARRALAAGEPLSAEQAQMLLAQVAHAGNDILVDAGRLTRPEASEAQIFSSQALAGNCGFGQAVTATYLRELGIPADSLHVLQAADVFGDQGMRHAFLVARMPDGRNYLVDLTFRQFLNPEYTGTNQIGEPGVRLRSTPEGQHFADELLARGFVELTDENAALYGQALGLTERRFTAADFVRRPADRDTTMRALDFDYQELGDYAYRSPPALPAASAARVRGAASPAGPEGRIAPARGPPTQAAGVEPAAGAPNAAVRVATAGLPDPAAIAARMADPPRTRDPQRIEAAVAHMVERFPGLSRAQALELVRGAFSRGSPVVISGSRLRGTHRPGSDLDVGFYTSRSAAQKITDRAGRVEGGLPLEQTRIVPDNDPPGLARIQSPEEFFMRAGTRQPPDPRAGEPYGPSGFIRYDVDGSVVEMRPDGTLTTVREAQFPLRDAAPTARAGSRPDRMRNTQAMRAMPGLNDAILLPGTGGQLVDGWRMVGMDGSGVVVRAAEGQQMVVHPEYIVASHALRIGGGIEVTFDGQTWSASMVGDRVFLAPANHQMGNVGMFRQITTGADFARLVTDNPHLHSVQTDAPGAAAHGFQLQQPVQVLRSNGQIEAGWYVHGFRPDGSLEVRNGQGAAKFVAAADLAAWQTGVQPAGQPQAPAAGPAFAPAQNVRVRRSSGAIEEWVMVRQQEDGTYLVSDPNGQLARVVTESELRQWQRLPLGNPAEQPGVRATPGGVGLRGQRPVAPRPPAERQAPAPSIPTAPAAHRRAGPGEPGGPQGLRSHRLAAGSEPAQVVRRFNTEHRLGPGDRVPDGYVDGGRGMHIVEQGGGIEYTSPHRELIMVDRGHPMMQRSLEFARSLRGRDPPLTETQVAQALAEHVDVAFSGQHRGDGATLDRLSEAWATAHAGEVLSLGQIMDPHGAAGGIGVCRHRSLLFKILADEVGIQSSLVRGRILGGAHAWNEVVIDGQTFILDATLNTGSNPGQLQPAQHIGMMYRQLNGDGWYGE